MITKTQIYLLRKLPWKLQLKIKINENGCWIYNGQQNRNGYGRFYVKRMRWMTHRLTYTIVKGPIKGILDHNCRCRICCNPTHLSDVTHKQNTHRGKAVLFTKT